MPGGAAASSAASAGSAAAAAATSTSSKRAAAEELNLVEAKLEEVDRQLRALKEERAGLAARRASLKEQLNAKTVDVDWSGEFEWDEEIAQLKEKVFGIAAPFRPMQVSLAGEEGMYGAWGASYGCQAIHRCGMLALAATKNHRGRPSTARSAGTTRLSSCGRAGARAWCVGWAGWRGPRSETGACV